MKWLTDRELGELDDFLRGNTAPGDVAAFLAAADGILALCRAFPRLSHEVRALRGEATRLRLGLAQESENARRLERELSLAHAQITGLESQLRAA